MEAFRTLMNPKWKSRFALLGAAILVLSFAFALQAEAKCTIRVADPLITARYQECKPREFLSYLYNDLVTPFSFTCAKKLSATCREENCGEPATEEETHRCLDRYVVVLNECNQQIRDAARMARCKDTNEWPVETVLARVSPTRREPASPGIYGPALIPSRPVVLPDYFEVPVTVEPLPETRTSQSSRR